MEGAFPTEEGPRANPATIFPIGGVTVGGPREGVVLLLQVIQEGSEQTGIGTTSPPALQASPPESFGVVDPNPFSFQAVSDVHAVSMTG